MKRVIFVGVHNKPGKTPLDSSTISGKRIDQVIKGLPGCQCVKTNLYEIERQPADKQETDALVLNWLRKYGPKKTDVVVLLGSQVQYSFPKIEAKIVRLAHPSLQYSVMKPDEYVKNAITLIKRVL